MGRDIGGDGGEKEIEDKRKTECGRGEEVKG